MLKFYQIVTVLGVNRYMDYNSIRNGFRSTVIYVITVLGERIVVSLLRITVLGERIVIFLSKMTVLGERERYLPF